MCVDACKAKGMNEISKGGKVHTYELAKERERNDKQKYCRRGKEREKGMINLCVCACVCVRNTYITCLIRSLAINYPVCVDACKAKGMNENSKGRYTLMK